MFICDACTKSIERLTDTESRSLLDALFAHLYRPEFRYHHRWQLGDLLIWDNAAVQHKATFDYGAPLRRKMQRCTLEGTAPY